MIEDHSYEQGEKIEIPVLFESPLDSLTINYLFNVGRFNFDSVALVSNKGSVSLWIQKEQIKGFRWQAGSFSPFIKDTAFIIYSSPIFKDCVGNFIKLSSQKVEGIVDNEQTTVEVILRVDDGGNSEGKISLFQKASNPSNPLSYRMEKLQNIIFCKMIFENQSSEIKMLFIE